MSAEIHTMARPFATVRGLLVACVSMLVALAGDWGPALLEVLDSGFAHHSVHLFHVLLPFAAVMVFAGLVARDVRLHGWPAFSWRLTFTLPEPAPEHG
jgi:hypothetical protein